MPRLVEEGLEVESVEEVLLHLVKCCLVIEAAPMLNPHVTELDMETWCSGFISSALLKCSSAPAMVLRPGSSQGP